MALRGTFESLIGSTPQNVGDEISILYPLDAAIAQINTVLDMANALLRIEHLCISRTRIKQQDTK